NFACGGTQAPIASGINTLLFTASATPVPDIVALAATASNDGVVRVANGAGAFSVATINMGATGVITASADTGGAALPVTINVCQTNPATSACMASPAPSVTVTILPGATPTFGIFVTATGTVPFDPSNNRVFVRFKDNVTTRGSTSVAVTTPQRGRRENGEGRALRPGHRYGRADSCQE